MNTLHRICVVICMIALGVLVLLGIVVLVLTLNGMLSRPGAAQGLSSRDLIMQGAALDNALTLDRITHGGGASSSPLLDPLLMPPALPPLRERTPETLRPLRTPETLRPLR